jgi:predicted nucleic acid-binding protein
MGLIIDTNVFIDIENGRIDTGIFERFLHYGEAYISVVTVSELLAGVHLAKSADERIKRSAFVEGILSNIVALDFNEDVARTYAELYSYAISSKKNINKNAHDLQIAATAINNGYAVLTSNRRDFELIPGLMVESP